MKFISSTALCLFLLGCSTVDYAPQHSTNSVFGKWRMVSYADSKQVPFDVTIELKNERDSLGRYIIAGKSPLNFYFSTFEMDTSTSSMTVYDIQSTKIEGNHPSSLFEKDYYERLTKTKSYEISNNGDTLKLILPIIENQHIIYKLIR